MNPEKDTINIIYNIASDEGAAALRKVMRMAREQKRMKTNISLVAMISGVYITALYFCVKEQQKQIKKLRADISKLEESKGE